MTYPMTRSRGVTPIIEHRLVSFYCHYRGLFSRVYLWSFPQFSIVYGCLTPLECPALKAYPYHFSHVSLPGAARLLVPASDAVTLQPSKFSRPLPQSQRVFFPPRQAG